MEFYLPMVLLSVAVRSVQPPHNVVIVGEASCCTPVVKLA